MPFEFRLPDVGEGVAEGEIVEWLVEPGDPVSEDQPVAEVETDKAVVEVPSPVHGTVRELLAEEGEMVPVGTVIITFDVEGEAHSAPESASGGEPRAGEEPDEVDVDPEPETTADDAEPAAEGDGEADATEIDREQSATGGRVFAAPSARRLARELDVDIAAVPGSGPGGRVTEADVRAAAESEPAAETPESGPAGDGETPDSAADAEPAGESTVEAGEAEEAGTPETNAETAAPADVEPADRDRTLAAPATRRVAEEEGVNIDAVPAVEEREGEAFVTAEAVREYAAAQRAAQQADAERVAAGGEGAGGTATGAEPADAAGAATAEGGPREERIPYRGIRRTIGEGMVESKFTIPHVTHHDEVDVTELIATRERLKPRAEERGIRLTFMPFVMKAAVAALKEHPVLNAQLDEEAEEIVLKKYYNFGVATATEAGLMVPVVDDVDRKGMLQLASEMNELVEKARERTIAREEMQGSTFTITNFGAVGGEYATPVINYPETAILGLGEIKEKPRVVDGEIVPRSVMTLSVSIDHRVVDGADVGRFTNLLMEYLEDPSLLLLE